MFLQERDTGFAIEAGRTEGEQAQLQGGLAVEACDVLPYVLIECSLRSSQQLSGDTIDGGAPDPRTFAPRARIVSSEELIADSAESAYQAVNSRDGVVQGFWLHLDLDVLSSDGPT